MEPRSGAHFFWEFSHLDSTCFQHFLDQLAQAFPDTLNLLQMDNGSFQKPTTLQLSANVLPIFQPAHSPELNPIERLWQQIKALAKGGVVCQRWKKTTQPLMPAYEQVKHLKPVLLQEWSLMVG